MAIPLGEVPGSRGTILDVAEALFARRGFAGVGLREVATAAGLGKSSLFHHFPSKAALYLAVLRRVLEGLELRLAEASGPGSPAEQLDGCIDALVDALAEQPTRARLLLRGLFEEGEVPDDAEGREEVDAAVDRIVERLRGLVREGCEAGAFRPVSEADTLQTLIGATVYHFASGSFGEQLLGEPVFGEAAVARRKRELKALFHRGIAARSGEGPPAAG